MSGLLPGGGKYDDAMEAAYQLTGGSVLLIVMDGNKGHGFSVKANPMHILTLPQLLRHVADQMEKGAGRA